MKNNKKSIKFEKIVTIKEEPVNVEKENEPEKEKDPEKEPEKENIRKKAKHQTFAAKKSVAFKSPTKEKRQTFIGGKNSNPLKKTIFSDKRIDQIFIKKIRESIFNSSVFEILGIKEKNKKNYDNISHELKKYEQKIGVSLNYTEKKSLRDEPPENVDQILKIISTLPEKRTFHDVFLMKKYLLETKIDWLFKDEFENKEESIEKLLTFFSLEMNYKLFKEGQEVFKVGDLSVYLYLIIKGKIEILKPTPEINLISGYEYFSYIIDLKEKKEEHLLNINLEENYKQYDINKTEVNLLPAIYIYLMLEKIKSKEKINFEEDIDLIHLMFKDIEFDDNELIHSYEHLFNKIKEKLPFVHPYLLRKYKFIIDKINKKRIKLIKYTRVLVLGNNEFFGESAMGQNEKRNATIRVLEDSYLGYLSANLYKTNFFVEKKLAMQNKINFLNTRFFFKYINFKRFANKYFNLFVYEKYRNGTILFKENEQLNYVYFIEDGLVELTSTKTMLEIEIFLRGLAEKFLLKEQICNLKYKELKSRTKDLEDYLNKTQFSKILIVGRNESLGIESFFYGIPYYATAKVVSERAKIFKISTDQLWQILNIEGECISILKNLVLNKAKILQNRLFEMNNTKLVLLDNKIIFNYQFDFDNNYRKGNIEEKKNEKNNKKINKKFLALSPNNMTGISRNKKKNIFLNLKDNSTKNKNQLLLKSMSDFNKNEKIKEIKNRKIFRLPSFEDRWLAHAKNGINILNQDKQFVSLYNNKLDKEIEVNNINEKSDKEEENNKKEKNDKNNNNNENNNNKRQESMIISNSKNLDSSIQNSKLNKVNSFNESILPSISSNKHSENANKFSTNGKNINNNYTYSMNVTSEKNMIKSSKNSYNNSIIFRSIENSINRKNNSKKHYIKLIHKKYNNFYEIKNDYDKKKFRFYNDIDIFTPNKERKNKSIEITNYKESKNKSSDYDTIKYSKIQLMKNKEIITLINDKIKNEENCEK